MPKTDELYPYNDLLQGAIDFHIHVPPDLVPRKQDALDIARELQAAGMRGAVLKDHLGETIGQSYAVNKLFKGVKLFGSLTLNYPVGGLNPYAVEAAIGKKVSVIYFPTLSSRNHVRKLGIDKKYTRLFPLDKRGITIFDGQGRIIEEVEEILRLVSKAGVVLSTGHLSFDEVKPLIIKARTVGVDKIVIPHVSSNLMNFPLEEQIWLTKQGVYLEHCFRSTRLRLNSRSIEEMVYQIKHTGPKHCIMSTDLGQTDMPAPVQGIKEFINLLLCSGISQSEVRMMVKENPRLLLM